MKKLNRLLCVFLAVIIMCTTICYSGAPSASALYSFTIQRQNVSKWSSVYVGGGTMYNTGCGIFALVNAVGCLTGKDMGVQSVANWAHSIGGYNVTGGEGTYRGVLYPKVQAKYGATYGFTVDCNGGDGYWAGSSSTTLKNHLKNGGVAVGHVPSHFIAILEYNSSTNKYHIYDSYPTSSRGTSSSGGDCWVTPSQLASGKLYLDWFCLLTKADDGTIQDGPTLTITPSTVRYGDSVKVSWAKVDNANEYWYRVNQYDAEPSGRDLIPYTQIVPKTTTTSRSFTVTAPEGCKYLRISVGAVGDKNSVTTTKTIPVGPDVSLPTDGIKYITPDKFDNSVVTDTTTVWTSKADSPFEAVWWPAATATLQADGTYTVNAVYASGDAKSLTVTGGDIIIAAHLDGTNSTDYNRVKALKVGDRLSVHGLYLDYGKTRGEGFIAINEVIETKTTITAPASIALGEAGTISWGKVSGATSYNVKVVNGANAVLNTNVTGTSISIPAQSAGSSLTVTVTPKNSVMTGAASSATVALADPVPTDITVAPGVGNTIRKGTAFAGYVQNTTAATVFSTLAEDSKYLEIRNTAGTVISDTDKICTGYTVNIVDNGAVVKSYQLAVTGDSDGDGIVSTSDYIALKTHINASNELSGAYFMAADIDADDVCSTTDMLLLKGMVSG